MAASDTQKSTKSALIIGASRGLGLGLAKELLGRGWHVTVTLRSAARGSGLDEFHGQVTLDTLDINNLNMVNAFVERIKNQVFDVVFVNAGVAGPEGRTAETVTAEEMTHVFMTNAVAPVRLAYKLIGTVKPETGILAFMSSILGSITLGATGWAPVYAASKAALNHFTANLVNGIERKDITVLSVHPGWVRTDMGGEHADIDVATSVRGIADVLEAKAGAGGHEFIDYKGASLPW